MPRSTESPGGPVNGALTRTKRLSPMRPTRLVNNEIGWKTQWFDRRLEFNGAVYQEDWKNVQVQIFDSCCYGNLSFVTNGPDYRVRGVETEVVGRVTHELTVIGSASWNSSNLSNAPLLMQPNGQPIVIPVLAGPEQLWRAARSAAEHARWRKSPPFQASLRARYEFVGRRLQGVLAGRRHAPGAFLRSHRQHPDLRPSRRSRPTMRRWVWRKMPGSPSLRAEPDQYARQFVRERQPIRRPKTINRPRTMGVQVRL